MKEEIDEIFGKFQKSKAESLAAIKGGLVSSETTTTLCRTTESMFDTDPQTSSENADDARCSTD